ncbi:MAG TPA: hypothetical protein VHY58_01360 [Streptosporangiaceae bacterium]|jgi:hypothetical protein|nr:hypothetical protein [Streptosporangiaceae bacterium]
MLTAHHAPALVQVIIPTSLIYAQGIEVIVTALASVLVSLGALWYFRRVRLERPPVGLFNGRDIVTLLVFVLALPFLYAALPQWALTCFLALTFASSLSIGYRPVVGTLGVWLGIGLLIGLNIWTSRTLEGSTGGWQLWWAELDVMVILGAIAVANLYVQGGMKLKHVAWFALGLGVYDIIFTTGAIPITNKLVEEFLGAPLDPSVGMRFGLDNFAIGIGDLLVYGMFMVACYKAYGRKAAQLAFALVVLMGAVVPNLFPLVVNFIDQRHDVAVPDQAFFGPVIMLCYLWLRHRYGRERTMAEYWASADAAPRAAGSPQSVPASEPVRV